MLYLLDTNVCVRYLNGRSQQVRDRVLAAPTDEMAMCSVVKAELFFGAMRSNNPVQTLATQQGFLNRFTSLPFDDEAALIFGQIRAHLNRIGTPIGSYDLQIAAIALTHNLTLITHNTAEFSRVNDLAIEHWEVEA